MRSEKKTVLSWFRDSGGGRLSSNAVDEPESSTDAHPRVRVLVPNENVSNDSQPNLDPLIVHFAQLMNVCALR